MAERPLHLVAPGATKTLCGIRLTLSEAYPHTGIEWRQRYEQGLLMTVCAACSDAMQ